MTTQAQMEFAVSHLRVLLDCVRGLEEEHGLDPYPNSPAEQELTASSAPEHVKAAHVQGEMLLGSAFMHVGAVIELFSQGQATLAPAANARAVVENSSMAWWLLDPNVHSEERLRRSLALRYRGIRDTQALLVAGGKQTNDPTLVRRQEHVERLYNTVTQSKNIPLEKREIKIGSWRPNYTAITEAALGSSSYYRILSALTHADVSMCRQMGWSIVDDNESEGERIEEISLNPFAGALFCYASANAYLVGTDARFRLKGWDHVELANVTRSLLHTIGLAMQPINPSPGFSIDARDPLHG